jgi:hypothetical protein
MQTALRSNKQLVEELRTAPKPWVDAAIVVAFEDRFEFVGEDHPDALGRLNGLQVQGGLAIGLAGVTRTMRSDSDVLHTQIFQEYVGQAWAHRYMDTLQGIVRSHAPAPNVRS